MFKKAIFYLIMLITPFLVLEVFFRFLPVSDPPYISPVNPQTPVVRYQKDIDFTWSSGWNFSNRTRKHTNNFGYVHKTNYLTDSEKPLMMIIGDSFVESFQTNNGNSAAELLHEETNAVGRVYSMGLSGSSLAQYLVFAEHARHLFKPDSLTFFIIGNDFTESWLRYKMSLDFITLMITTILLN